MTSAVINRRARRATDTAQMTLSFEPGLTQSYGSLRECIAAGIYKRGLSNVAPSLDKAPGNLSTELSDDPLRKFGVESFELYLERFKDFTPIYYLIEKFLGEPDAAKDSAISELSQQLAQMQELIKRAGLT